MKKMIRVENLKKYFKLPGGLLKAVDDVSFDIHEGETFGLVGESGCGKTTLGRTLLRLYEPTAGAVYMEDENILNCSGSRMLAVRKNMQMIFQDPYASLDPRLQVEDIVAEPLDVHKITKNSGERHNRVLEMLNLVGLGSEHASRFPHEFSGGQRQRVGIARSLVLNPKFIVCDEPISALDVSIQAQVVNLLKDLQKKMGLTYLFIAHDLSMVHYISDRVGVMYLGKLVELAASDVLYDEPLHPYTKALLSAIPVPDPDLQKKRERIVLQGDVPSPINPKPGCRFKDRCVYAIDRCQKEEPVFEEVRDNHFVACHRTKEFLAGFLS